MKTQKITVAYKIWLEKDGKPMLGKGGAQILEAIKTEKSVSKAAEKLGMSYRYVWNYVDRMNTILGEPVVKAYRGGKQGGGGANLTMQGEQLLKKFKQTEKRIKETLTNKQRPKA
ncbi:MAG: LysR family transcriptional regulator [Candidatus Bathyarchaeia archaeon]|nr:LysR family transcriptional regulator [Candidatus Bathyarchaeota archaeon]